MIVLSSMSGLILHQIIVPTTILVQVLVASRLLSGRQSRWVNFSFVLMAASVGEDREVGDGSVCEELGNGDFVVLKAVVVVRTFKMVFGRLLDVIGGEELCDRAIKEFSH